MLPPSARIRAWSIAAAVLASGITLAWPAQASHAAQVPCGDFLGRGCPDLTVDPATMSPSAPKTKNFKPQSCVVQEGTIPAGIRTVIYFTYTTPNLGPGDLVIGRPEDHPEWFEFDPCHEHFHMREYADYRVWTLDGYAEWDALRNANPDQTPAEVFAANPGLLDEFIFGGKRGFCVIDLIQYDPLAPPKFLLCDFQGISVGWADEYFDGLDGQFVDVTGAPPGDYMLEEEVNPERLFIETNYANNRGAVRITI